MIRDRELKRRMLERRALRERRGLREERPVRMRRPSRFAIDEDIAPRRHRRVLRSRLAESTGSGRKEALLEKCLSRYESLESVSPRKLYKDLREVGILDEGINFQNFANAIYKKTAKFNMAGTIKRNLRQLINKSRMTYKSDKPEDMDEKFFRLVLAYLCREGVLPSSLRIASVNPNDLEPYIDDNVRIDNKPAEKDGDWQFIIKLKDKAEYLPGGTIIATMSVFNGEDSNSRNPEKVSLDTLTSIYKSAKSPKERKEALEKYKVSLQIKFSDPNNVNTQSFGAIYSVPEFLEFNIIKSSIFKSAGLRRLAQRIKFRDDKKTDVSSSNQQGLKDSVQRGKRARHSLLGEKRSCRRIAERASRPRRRF